MALSTQILDPEGRKLLDTIDELRRLTHIAHEIPLPQIIVVGQQSSGKSSVLSAISKIPFPTESGLCTQFAIEIVCRRSLDTTTKATIRPYHKPDAPKQARIDAFSSRWSSATINTQTQVAQLISEARSAMGLTTDKGYSHDKLIIETQGPSQEHLTLIDLPGLISIDKEDMQQVDSLIVSYLAQEQTIILGIVHGFQDRQSQRLFEMAIKHWEDTIGVITAADMVDWKGNGGANIKVQVSDSASHHPRHGWYIVRNLSPKEVREGKDRDAVERAFFNGIAGTDEWNGMGHVPWGIDNLRKKLSTVLQSRISSSIPDIQRIVDSAIDRSNSKLRALGEDRSTETKQKHYLTASARLLRNTVRNGLEGRSSALDLTFEHRSLRDKVRNANEAFAEEMLSEGHTWELRGDGLGDCSDRDESKEKIEERCETETELDGDDDDGNPGYAFQFDRSQPYPISANALHRYIAETIRANQGRALRGTFDPGWVGTFFHRQSRKWKTIVLRHADSVSDIVESELAKLIHDSVAEETAKKLLDKIYEPDLKARREKLQEKVYELLSPYTTQYPSTLNRLYEERLVKLDKQAKAGLWKGKASGDWDITLRAGAHIYHCMELYYNVAINVLLDNVQSLAVENVLLDGLDDIFKPESVADMDTDQLHELASESAETAKQRTSEQEKLRDLEKARRILSQNAPRRALKEPVHRPQSRTVTPSPKTTPQRNRVSNSSPQTKSTNDVPPVVKMGRHTPRIRAATKGQVIEAAT